MVYVVTPILFIIVTQAKSDGESRKTDIFPGLPRYGQATTCGQGNLASGNNQLLKNRAPTWREVFRPPEMSSVNFRIRKSISSLEPTFGKFSVFEVETRNSKIGRGNRVLEKEFRFLPITQVGLIEHVPLTIFHSFPINACVPKNRGVET